VSDIFKMHMPHWTGKTFFLRWSLMAGAGDVPYLHAQVAPCELDVVVCRDTSGKTWAVMIGGDVLQDEIAAPITAQIVAVGLVIRELAHRAGDPVNDAENDAQRNARAMLQMMHDATRLYDLTDRRSTRHA
jgi:hypothetical protein